jgi:hypothetical protein
VYSVGSRLHVEATEGNPIDDRNDNYRSYPLFWLTVPRTPGLSVQLRTLITWLSLPTVLWTECLNYCTGEWVYKLEADVLLGGGGGGIRGTCFHGRCIVALSCWDAYQILWKRTQVRRMKTAAVTFMKYLFPVLRRKSLLRCVWAQHACSVVFSVCAVTALRRSVFERIHSTRPVLQMIIISLLLDPAFLC